jgi:hypothetical protein
MFLFLENTVIASFSRQLLVDHGFSGDDKSSAMTEVFVIQGKDIRKRIMKPRRPKPKRSGLWGRELTPSSAPWSGRRTYQQDITTHRTYRP